jgi:hypothetical protein
MAIIKKTFVSLDAEEIQSRNISGNTIAGHLYKANGWVAKKVNYTNSEYSNESRVVDPKCLYRTLFHTHFTGESKRYNPYKKKSFYVEAVTLFVIAGLCSHHNNNDRLKGQARDLIVDFVKTNGGVINYKGIDVAIDAELEDIKNLKIDNFFLLQLSKSEHINSPFKYFTGEDGSRTYYMQPMKDPNDKNSDQQKKKKYIPKRRIYMYLKHIKEGLRNRFILRVEASYTGLDSFGGDSDKLITYIEKDLKGMRLFCFDNVDTGNDFKRQYEARIPKKYNDNVTPTMLSKIKSKADNEIEIGLTDEIKDHIRNVLARKEPNPVEVWEPNHRKAYRTLFGKSSSEMCVLGKNDPSIGLWEPTRKNVDQKEPKPVERKELKISEELRNRLRKLKSEDADTSAESGI